MDFSPDDWIARCHVADVPGFTAKMEHLYTLLTEANAVTNLTRITSPEGFWIKHVIDSLQIAAAFPNGFQKGAEWLDLGCGGGFPSLVLAAAFPQINLTAIDSTAKKTRFVESARVELGLNNMNVITGRGRELANLPAFRTRYTGLTARAVAEPSEIIKEVGKMVRKNGYAVLYQTPEQAQSESVTTMMKSDTLWSWTLSPITELPLDMGRRCFLIGRKI